MTTGRARALVLAAAVLFGTAGTARALGPHAPALGGAAARIVIGGGVLAAGAIATGVLRPGLGLPPGLLLAGGVAVAAYQALFFAAVADTGVAVGTIVAIGTGPVVAGALWWAWRGEAPGGRWAAATALAVAGAALLVGVGSAGVHPGGVLLALASGAIYGTYTVLGKDLLERGLDPVAAAGATFGLGALLMLPVLLAGPTAWLTRPGGIALALYLGLFTTALAYVCFYRGLGRLSPATVTTLVLAEPLTAALLGAVVLGERLGPAGVAGAGLVLAGLAILGLPRRRGAAGRLTPPA